MAQTVSAGLTADAEVLRTCTLQVVALRGLDAVTATSNMPMGTSNPPPMTIFPAGHATSRTARMLGARARENEAETI